MTKYRKKPVVVDAVQFTDEESVVVIKELIRKNHTYKISDDDFHLENFGTFVIYCEGLRLHPSQWILCDEKRKFTRLKDEEFKATYELVEE